MSCTLNFADRAGPCLPRSSLRSSSYEATHDTLAPPVRANRLPAARGSVRARSSSRPGRAPSASRAVALARPPRAHRARNARPHDDDAGSASVESGWTDGRTHIPWRLSSVEAGVGRERRDAGRSRHPHPCIHPSWDENPRGRHDFQRNPAELARSSASGKLPASSDSEGTWVVVVVARAVRAGRRSRAGVQVELSAWV
jgi:hypothetical protein